MYGCNAVAKNIFFVRVVAKKSSVQFAVHAAHVLPLQVSGIPHTGSCCKSTQLDI
jgi:hypothetical protein